MYIEVVERHSKYAAGANNIFAYNFFNIQPIFNLKKALESCALGLSSYTIKYYVYGRGRRSNIATTATIDATPFTP